MQVLALVGVLLLFFVSIELMGSSFKLMGEGVAETLLRMTSNPFVGLFVGIMATSFTQSSSTVTSMTVAIVAGGGFGTFAEAIPRAVPIIMGSNIGTSVTSTIVSFGSVTRKEEFRRAMAGATVHDFFNLLAVAVLFPLELLFQVVSRSAAALTDLVAGVGGTQLFSPLQVVTDPIVSGVIELVDARGLVVLALGLVLLFLSLRYLVKLLRALILGRAEQLLHRYIFNRAIVSMAFGALITMLVQSSSITTSLIVPLVGAGILTVPQVFPFVLGANIGTTVTAIIAALLLAGGGTAAGIAALTVAFAHLFFNIYGILIFYPIRALRRIPIWMAERLGDLGVKNRLYAIAYVGVVFFLIPFLVIFATRDLEIDYETTVPEALEENAAPAPGSYERESYERESGGEGERVMVMRWEKRQR